MKRPKLKVQVKSFDLQKESIKSELRNSNCSQKKFKFKSACNQILICQNHVQVDYLERGEQNEVLALVSLDLDERAKSCEGFKIRD